MKVIPNASLGSVTVTTGTTIQPFPQMTTSGHLKSRPFSPPATPLTDKKITAYILAGKYGEAMRLKELARQKKKVKSKKKKPTTIKLHPNSMALTNLSHLL